MTKLDAGEMLAIQMCNPNPTSSKRKDGPIYRVSFELTQEDWLEFMDSNTDGMILDCVMQPARDTGGPAPEIREGMQREGGIEPKKEKREPGPFSEFAKALHGSGLFMMPMLWDAVGGEDAHAEYIRRLDCVVCGKQDYIAEIGEGRCEQAHMRSAEDSGTAYKPRYFSVPLCHAHHVVQHQKGESAVGLGRGRGRKIAARLVKEWAVNAVKSMTGVESMTDLSPDSLYSALSDAGAHESILDRVQSVAIASGFTLGVS